MKNINEKIDCFNFDVNMIFDDKNETSKYSKENEEELKIEKVYLFFDEQRVEWTETLKKLSSKFSKMNLLTELQVDLFSNRQVLIEKKMYITDLFNKLNKKAKIMKANNFRDLRSKENLYTKSNSDFKLLLEEKDANIDEKLAMYSNHLNFLQETINTIDRMIFGVKHRLQIYEYIDKDQLTQ